MKRINVNANVAFALPLFMFLLATMFIAIAAASGENQNELHAVFYGLLLSAMFTVFFTSTIVEEMGFTAHLISVVVALSPSILYTIGIMNLLDTIVISEILKILLAVLVSLDSIKKTNETKRPSKIFWRLVISLAILNFALLVIFYGANTMITFTVSALACIATWIFLPESKDELKTELEKINGQENMLSEQKKFLPIAAVIFGFSVLILQIREIYLAINAPIEQQEELVIKIIVMLMSCLAVLAAGYMINKKLNQQLDSLWSQKKLITLA